ncbi:MAG TPA: hypothetical protein VD788_16405, partial [Candidatus Polarisedimenticolaceae bacterium]|nr:hypothetical protein [Candidatus Polarisedimenticolaceae bacterium]
EKMTRLYLDHLRKVARQLDGRRNFERLDVDYRATIDDPRGQAERVARFLELPLDTARMVAAVDPTLYRNRDRS